MNEVNRMRRVVAVCFVVSLVAGLGFAPQVRAEGKAACTAWLTKAEVEKALGVTLDAGEPVEYSPGFTVCSWTKDRPEGGLGIHLSFMELKAMQDGPLAAATIPEYFDNQVASKKESDGKEPKTLEGIGKRAVMFTEEYLAIVMIELEEGFAHLSISPADDTAQLEALAKAVAAHEKK